MNSSANLITMDKEVELLRRFGVARNEAEDRMIPFDWDRRKGINCFSSCFEHADRHFLLEGSVSVPLAANNLTNQQNF